MSDLYRTLFILSVVYLVTATEVEYPNVCKKNTINKEETNVGSGNQEPEYECCPGYEGSIKDCKPVCTTDCGPNSFCRSPDVCQCIDGYILDGSGCCVQKSNDPHLCSIQIKGKEVLLASPAWNELELEFNKLNMTLPKPLPSSYTTETRQVCCDGYERKSEKDLCEPQCTERCGEHSFCAESNLCECHLGYYVAQNGSCVKDTTVFAANDPHVCSVRRRKFVDLSNYFNPSNPSVSHPETLIRTKFETYFFCCPGYEQAKSGDPCQPIRDNHGPCRDGYVKNQFDDCAPVCSQECPPYSTCIQPENCQCSEGYTNSTSEDDSVCEPVCAMDIPENGFCVRPNEWECDLGYVKLLKPDSPDFYCAPHCEDSCASFAKCVEPNVCKCMPGYKIMSMVIDANGPRDLCVLDKFDKYHGLSFRNSHF